MRKILRYIIPAVLCICLLNACKKSFNEQQSVPITPETPDLSVEIKQNVTGYISNENGAPVANAIVIAGSKSTTTDQQGHFVINDVTLSKTAGFIKVSNPGYFDGYRTFVGIANQETFVKVQLVPKTEIGTINAASGGTVNTPDGASVVLPSNAVVIAATNAAYSGNIHVAAHLYNQADINQFSKMMPGDLRGTDSAAQLRILKSYGMLAVELTGDAGELLQITTGKEATITTPIPSTLVADAPANIPLWSFDVTKGLWKQEGTTTKNGNSYTGNVKHFSFWDGATGTPVVNFTAQIVNSAMQAIGNIFICIRRADDPNIGTSAFTNNQGTVSGAVLANTELVLQVYTLCGGTSLVYSQNFTTTNSDVDMGTISANLGDLVTVTGRVVDCNNVPITDGWVLLWIANVTWHMPVVNGNIVFSTTSCSNMTSSYLAVNWGGSQQGLTQSFNLVPGANNLGTIQACGVSTVGFVDYSIDNGPTIHLIQPRDTQKMIATYDGLSETNIITIDRDGNPVPNMSFAFNGGTSLGTGHTTDLIDSRGFPSGRANAYAPYTPLTVTITEFGVRGGFIAGSFEGHVQDQNDHTDHLVRCTFRVRRI
ncbi:MAG TPA: carboxypeptidase-like regulatory domain-containing protein [Ferruginibacter sp.]|nr:carboxypeptidase-like regulatory domain-containing protein [Ferruginibacter sp.]